jgi:hypothetical protein
VKAMRIAYSKNINPGKYAALEEQAKRLGAIRSEVWQRYGSIAGVKPTSRQNRDNWLAQGRTFNVLARLYDHEIDRWMPFIQVKSILLERTKRLRLGLLNPDRRIHK